MILSINVYKLTDVTYILSTQSSKVGIGRDDKVEMSPNVTLPKFRFSRDWLVAPDHVEIAPESRIHFTALFDSFRLAVACLWIGQSKQATQTVALPGKVLTR
ncbi:hypothetical protein V1478_001940 [Vespula squamosa]|uniref:Uncharacterized protein n=1 Tax=Vespula squamosa TaxID=30214 RepID=A0ABD2BYN0_VESSQ